MRRSFLLGCDVQTRLAWGLGLRPAGSRVQSASDVAQHSSQTQSIVSAALSSMACTAKDIGATSGVRVFVLLPGRHRVGDWGLRWLSGSLEPNEEKTHISAPQSPCLPSSRTPTRQALLTGPKSLTSGRRDGRTHLLCAHLCSAELVSVQSPMESASNCAGVLSVLAFWGCHVRAVQRSWWTCVCDPLPAVSDLLTGTCACVGGVCQSNDSVAHLLAKAQCSADLLGCPAGPSHANGGAANEEAAPADADAVQAAAAAPQHDPLGAGSVGGDTVGWVSAVASCKGTDLVVRGHVHCTCLLALSLARQPTCSVAMNLTESCMRPAALLLDKGRELKAPPGLLLVCQTCI